MTNKWIEHIKAFAKAHNISYGCALSNPKCLATYKSKKKSGGRGPSQRKVKSVERLTLFLKSWREVRDWMEGGRMLNELVKMLRKLLNQYRQYCECGGGDENGTGGAEDACGGAGVVEGRGLERGRCRGGCGGAGRTQRHLDGVPGSGG